MIRKRPKPPPSFPNFLHPFFSDQGATARMERPTKASPSDRANPDEGSPFDTLPTELIAMVLAEGRTDPAHRTVWRLTCRTWGDILCGGGRDGKRSALPSMRGGRTLCGTLAHRGHLSLIKWATENGATMGKDLCIKAALGGHPAALKWARDNGAPWAGIAVNKSAALAGHLNVLKWMERNGLILWHTVCTQAALAGRLEVLEWCKTNKGSRWRDEKLCQYAAAGGHLHVVKWARENRLAFGSSFYRCAVEGKNAERMSHEALYVRSWDGAISLGVMNGDHLACLGSALANGLDQADQIYDAAATWGDVETLEWMNRVGVCASEQQGVI